MQLKFVGAVVIILSGILTGYGMCNAYRHESETLHNLIRSLDYMECELQYRMTPLPALIRDTAICCQGTMRKFWYSLAGQLDRQLLPDASTCMKTAITMHKELPPKTIRQLEALGQSLGRFDLNGQIEGIDAVRKSCRREWEALAAGQASYLRSCRTLAICVAVSLVILFI